MSTQVQNLDSNNLPEFNFSFDFLEYKPEEEKLKFDGLSLVEMLNRFFSQKNTLENFLEKETEANTSQSKIREFFLCFLKQEFKPIQDQLDQAFKEQKTCFLEIEETYGFDYLAQIFAEHRQSDFKEQVINLKLPESFLSASQIALYLLKKLEPSNPPVAEPLEQVKRALENKQISLILEFQDLKRVKSEELAVLLDSLKEANLLIRASNLNYLNQKTKSLIKKKVTIKKLSNQSALELIENFLKFRLDFIVTSASRKELLDLANLCGNSPEIILNLFLNFSLGKNIYLEKLVKKLLKTKNNFRTNQDKVLYGLLSSFPKEISFLLERINYLPEEGFSIKEVSAFCKDLFKDPQSLERALDKLTKVFSLRQKKGKGPKSYYLPSFLKSFLQAAFPKKERHLEQTYKDILIQRLTNSLYWKADVLWEGQVNRAIEYLEFFSQGIRFKSKTYFVLHLQSVLLELGFWREVQEILAQKYQKAINDSVGNQDRGYWYTIKGSLYRGISRYTKAYKDLQTALVDFQRALKFYNPQKVPKKYIFIYKNIGEIYSELAKLDSINEVDFLREAAKNHYKAFEYCQAAKESSSKVFSIQRAMAKIYRKLASKQVKPLENYLRAFEFLQEANLDLLENNRISPNTKGLLRELKLIENGLLELRENSNLDLEIERKIDYVLKRVKDEAKSISIKFN